MRKMMKDQNEPIGKLTRIDDFLPPPDKLTLPKTDNVKVTINLRKPIVMFFKQQSQKYHTKYQIMIRDLLDKYVAHYLP